MKQIPNKFRINIVATLVDLECKLIVKPLIKLSCADTYKKKKKKKSSALLFAKKNKNEIRSFGHRLTHFQNHIFGLFKINKFKVILFLRSKQ